MPAVRTDDGFGRFLEGYLAARRVHRSVLFQRADIDPSLFSKWVNGHQEIPREKLVVVIEAATEYVMERKRSGPEARP